MSQAVLHVMHGGDPEGEPAHRVLVVGDDSLATFVEETIRDTLSGPPAAADIAVHSSPTFLMALGEAWHAPPRVVIARLETMDPSGIGIAAVQSMASALRRVAPHARLLVVTTSDHEDLAVRAMSCGVDDYLLEPTNKQDLARMLALALGVPLAIGDSLAEPATFGDEEGELGDVDLVERLLEGRRGLQKLAVKLVAQRSGIEGVGWAATAEEAPRDHLATPIEMRGQTYGVLHAPQPAHAEELASWAAWLARWLALEDRFAQMQKLAYRDELTGMWNRRYFNQFLQQTLADAGENRKQVTLLVFDIDDFKLYNDKFGHGAGDEILRETARLMQSVVRGHDVVARIGGDEFAVIFWDPEGPRKQGSTHPKDVLSCAQRFQKAICAFKFPKLIEDVKRTLTISGGLATFPWDGRNPDDLLEQADQMAMRSKQQGKNAITLGPGATRLCVPDESA